MKRIVVVCASLLLLCSAAVSLAQDKYNPVPAGDRQYRQCLDWSLKRYDGGNEKSPIPGQTKAQAFCTCMWNETPDNFRGNLVLHAESERGKRVNKICEKYSDWAD